MNGPGYEIPYDGAEPVPPRRNWWQRILASRIIMLSILIHFLFGLGATCWIVETIQTKRKLAFEGGPKSPNPSTEALEHQINMARRQQTMSAPAQARRILSTGLSKISLPDMPAMPMADDITPGKMSGMGGMGIGIGLPGGGGGGGNGNGQGVTLFGLRGSGQGLRGTFWDTKQTPDRQSTGVNTIPKFAEKVETFVSGGWNLAYLDNFYKAPAPLYANQIFVPVIPSEQAPAAFGVSAYVKAEYWMAIYEGDISPPESGVYHFVGGADNVLIVKLNGDVVLKDSWDYDIMTSWRPDTSYLYHFLPRGVILIPPAFGDGSAMSLEAGQWYHIQILLGDDGGHCHFSLMVREEGVDYPRTAQGVPYFPVLRFAPVKPPEGIHPPYVKDGPVWKSRPSQATGFDSLF